MEARIDKIYSKYLILLAIYRKMSYFCNSFKRNQSKL